MNGGGSDAVSAEAAAVVNGMLAQINAAGGQDASQRQLWSGGAPARGMADQAMGVAGKSGAQQAGNRAQTRLEGTFLGALFDGVYNMPDVDWSRNTLRLWDA